MALESKISLKKETIDKLQNLIQVNIDSYNGFHEAAEQVDNPTFAKMFRQMASERSDQAEELRQLVLQNGAQPQDAGSGKAAMHRLWLDLRAAVTGGDAHAVLAEAERGEDYIKELYEEILKETAGSAVNDTLQRQHRQVKVAHDRVRDLRDAQTKS